MRRTPEIKAANASMSKKMTEHMNSFDRHYSTSPDGETTSETNVILVPQLETVFSRAARIIQRTWRTHVDTAVFKYLKKLVSFHNQGDPRLLLRFITPAEANILDAASGALIRFRLGGWTCVPAVLKITHSKRHQLQARFIMADGRSVMRMITLGGTSEWRTMAGGFCLARYAEGLLHARTEHSETALLVHRSTQRTMDSHQQIEPDSVSEQEVDELLAWTNALNFDEYVNEWMTLGTSNCCIVKEELPESDQRDFACVSDKIPPVSQDDSPVVSQHLDNI